MTGVRRGIRLLGAAAVALGGLGLSGAVVAAAPAAPIGITVTPSGGAQVLTPQEPVCQKYHIAIAGTSATVKGQGFPSGDTVTLKFDSTAVGKAATVTSSGTFTTKFTVPAAIAGQHSVTATGRRGEHATQLVHVAGATCFELAATGTNHTMKVSWSVGGVDAHSPTDFELSGAILKSTTTTSVGGLNTSFTAHCPTAGSTVSWVVHVVQSGQNAQASGFVTVPNPC